MTTLKWLKKLRNFVIRHGWTQGPCAVNNKGQEVLLNHPAACKFCLYGSVHKVTQHDSREADRILQKLGQAIEPSLCWGFAGKVIHYNETPGRKKKEILAVVDKAIAREKESCTQSS